MSLVAPFDLVLKDLRIPWVAAWETEARKVDIDPVVDMPAVFTGTWNHFEAAATGKFGKVLLGQMAPQRQRYAVAKGICQVCAKPHRNKVFLGFAHVMHDGLVAYDEPAACPSCAVIAIAQCPHAAMGFNSHGAIVAQNYQSFIQVVEIRKGDDRSALFKGGTGIDRAHFRRWVGKKLAMHLRSVPLGGYPLKGSEGLTFLEKLAELEAIN